MAKLPDPLQPTVDAIYAARAAQRAEKGEYEGYGISVSMLGSECDRQLWYSLRWASPVEPVSGRASRIFEHGEWTEERVLADLSLAGFEVAEVDPETGKQFRISGVDGFLRGKADGRVCGIPEAPAQVHNLEIKSMKAADFRAVIKHGLKAKKPEHWHQAHQGAIEHGLPAAFYIVENKDTDELHTVRIPADVEEGERQRARVRRIVDDHEGPPKASTKQDRQPCLFCKHKGVCHGGEFARRHCRTCVYFTFTRDGNGHCERFDAPLRPETQREGKECPAHIYLPGFVPGKQIDANREEEWIEYEMPDGRVWRDGGNRDGE